MKPRTIINIVFIVVLLAFVIGMIFVVDKMIKDKNFCESKGGEFDNGRIGCLFESNGIWESYEILKLNGIRRLVK